MCSLVIVMIICLLFFWVVYCLNVTHVQLDSFFYKCLNSVHCYQLVDNKISGDDRVSCSWLCLYCVTGHSWSGEEIHGSWPRKLAIHRCGTLQSWMKQLLYEWSSLYALMLLLSLSVGIASCCLCDIRCNVFGSRVPHPFQSQVHSLYGSGSARWTSLKQLSLNLVTSCCIV